MTTLKTPTCTIANADEINSFLARFSKVKTLELAVEGVLRRSDIVLPMSTLPRAIEAAKAKDMGTLVITFLESALERKLVLEGVQAENVFWDFSRK